MNDTVNRFLDGVANVADATVKAAGELVNKGKTQVSVLTLESKLQKAQAKLGAAAYTLIKENTLAAKALSAYVDEVDEVKSALLHARAAQAGSAVKKAKATKLCPLCGEEVEEDAMFCNGCGNKL